MGADSVAATCTQRRVGSATAEPWRHAFVTAARAQAEVDGGLATALSV